MRIESVNIMGLPFTVKYIDHPIAETGETYHCGDVDCNGGIIRIATSRLGDKFSEPAMRRTLLHEIIHAWNDAARMKICEEDTERLAMCIDVFVLDNPGFFNGGPDHE